MWLSHTKASTPLSLLLQIHKKEEKPGINYILGAGLQGDLGWPQGTLVHISSFLNFQDLDSSLGSE